MTFLSDFDFSDRHQVDQLGCESHTSCQSESILLGRALQTWVVGVGTGASCVTWEMLSITSGATTGAALCYCSFLV